MLLEDARVAGEGGEALLHARAARLDEADDGGTRAARELEDADDRLGVLLAERAAEVRRVLRVAEDGAAVDAAGAGDHAVTGAGLLAHPARADVGAEQREGARVAERLQALDRRELLFYLWDELDRHAASRHSTALWPPKPKAFERPMAGLPSMSRGRALPGT